MYQQPETQSYCPLGSPGGSLEVSGSAAARKRSADASGPNPHQSGSTQFFKTGPDPCVGARSDSLETVGSQAPLPAATAAPLPVSALPVAIWPIDFVQMAALQKLCPSVTEMCNSPVLFVVKREVQGI